MKTKFTFLFLFLILFSIQNNYAQEFSFDLYFEDAIGNKDTLVLGYDSTATNGIDMAFGEEDISNISMDSVFDIRITDLIIDFGFEIAVWCDSVTRTPSSFLTKKNIYQNSCDELYDITHGISLVLLIQCKNYPVTINWDNTLFVNECVDRSNIFLYHPARAPLFKECDRNGVDLPLFSSMLLEAPARKYLYPDGDTMGVFFISIIGNKHLISSTNEINHFKHPQIHPNPTQNTLYLNYELPHAASKEWILINSIGQVVYHKNLHSSFEEHLALDVSQVGQGLYFHAFIVDGVVVHQGKLVLLE